MPKKKASADTMDVGSQFFAEKSSKATLAELRSGVKPSVFDFSSRYTTPADMQAMILVMQGAWAQRVEEKKKEKENLTAGLGLQDLVKENEDIETVKKDNMFEGKVNQTEQDIIKKRVELQQKQFLEYQRREYITKLGNIMSMYPHLTRDEIEHALKELKENEDEVISHLSNTPFVYSIRRAIAKAAIAQMPAATHMTELERRKYAELILRRKRARATMRAQKGLTGGGRTGQRLKLDDALKSASSGKFEGWSEARIKAYQHIESNPNQYYYRFNAPGEQQRNGNWNEEEKKLFMQRRAEIGCDGKWGIFSMTIPGRVGYQCSNHYRKLIETGQVVDPNYFLDEKGKAHYLFKRAAGIKKKAAPKPKVSKAGKGKGKAKGKGKGKKRRRGHDTESDSDEWEDYRNFKDASWKQPQDNDGSESSAGDNGADEEEELLPGFVDPITLCPVTKPAISPYGHVMGYDNWLKCLQGEPKNTCCFTKKPLQKRELVVLTKDNLAEYKDKIVNWS